MRDNSINKGSNDNKNSQRTANISSAFSQTIYKEIASLHVGHSLKNRPYDNILFHKMVNNMGDIENKSILEFGCGHGHYANFLLKSGATNVFGVDIDDEAIKTAKSNSKDGGTFIHLSDDGTPKITDIGKSFDEIYAMYVYETIKEKSEIQSIFSDIYTVLACGGKFQFLVGNIEEFYGKKCVEFEFPINPKFPILQDGDPYTARLVTEHGFFDVQDFYHAHDAMVNMLTRSGFQDISTQKHMLCGNEYMGMIDEKQFAPSIIFIAKK